MPLTLLRSSSLPPFLGLSWPSRRALNIMWLHLGQRSFKLTAEQYAEKIDGVAQLVNVLGQTDKVGLTDV